MHTAAFGTLHRRTQRRRKIFDVWRDEAFATVVAGEDSEAVEHGITICLLFFSTKSMHTHKIYIPCARCPKPKAEQSEKSLC